MFSRVQGQPCSGETAFDEAGPVLDLLQAVPDDLGQYFIPELSQLMPSRFFRGRDSRTAQSPYASLDSPYGLIFAADRESGHAEYAEHDTGRQRDQKQQKHYCHDISSILPCSP